jgi:hypothetical protein
MSGFYDNADRTSYHFAQVDFGAGADITRVIAVPLDGKNARIPGVGKRGRVVGATIHNVTEDFAGSTSDARVLVGTGAGDTTYFASLATTALGSVTDETLDIGESVYLLDEGPLTGSADGFRQVDIEAGRTSITVTFVVEVGTPTGIADVTLDIDWY